MHLVPLPALLSRDDGPRVASHSPQLYVVRHVGGGQGGDGGKAGNTVLTRGRGRCLGRRVRSRSSRGGPGGAGGDGKSVVHDHFYPADRQTPISHLDGHRPLGLRRCRCRPSRPPHVRDVCGAQPPDRLLPARGAPPAAAPRPPPPAGDDRHGPTERGQQEEDGAGRLQSDDQCTELHR